MLHGATLSGCDAPMSCRMRIAAYFSAGRDDERYTFSDKMAALTSRAGTPGMDNSARMPSNTTISLGLRVTLVRYW